MTSGVHVRSSQTSAIGGERISLAQSSTRFNRESDLLNPMQ